MRCRFTVRQRFFLAFRRVLNGLYVDPVLPIEAQRAKVDDITAELVRLLEEGSESQHLDRAAKDKT
jgi:hypothetical protein